jgi:N-acetylglucosamine kinase-like BadF-type ATPase
MVSEPLVIGLDVGGTSTRALVASLTGERRGSGRARGGNPTSHGGDRAAARILVALREALVGVDPADVRAGTIGLAGAGRLLADPAASAALAAAWREAGLRCAYLVVGDALAAYAAGTPEPDGTVLIAGTGAIAAAVRGHRLEHVADGHGWLLGDAGSGYWIGRAAVRTALADLDARRTLGPLSRAVLTELLGRVEAAADPRETVDRLVQRANAGPPVALAALTPLVMDAHASGDPAAVRIVGAAARHLVSTVGVVRPAGERTPVVLAGGLLTAATPLALAVDTALATRWPRSPRTLAGDGAAGAAWLAARTLPGVDPAPLHKALSPLHET